ncbi:MAG TPA: M81 family metallopeptidase, partial [Clostridiaceae bacterium]|nr:M81 family metallopeptidase [Clostridiaceae bacterium]
EADVEIIPTLCAYAMPSGKVDEKTYLSYKNYIIDHIPQDEKIDGVWLYLHGAMNVENIGSGEGLLVSEIRKKVGPYVPIAVALDFHANNTNLLMKTANIVYGYRTVPHEDHKETQIRVAELLLKCIDENIHAESLMVRLPLLFPGEMVTTGVEPTKSLIKELDIAEKEEGVICASIFSGMPWTDASNAGASVVVVGKKGYPEVLKQAKRLAKLFWDAREKFKFEEEAAEPEDAVERAIRAKEELIFISDSGDNVTAGAAGDNTYLLSILLEKKVDKTLVAGITDSRVVRQFSSFNIGDSLKLKLGGELDSTSKTIHINTTLKGKGSIGGNGNRNRTSFVLINVDGIDIIVTDTRYSFTSPAIIECAGVKVNDYKIIVVKLGYIFPELRKISKRSIMALTPGSSCLTVDSFKFHHIDRPMFPVDKDFEWEP